MKRTIFSKFFASYILIIFLLSASILLFSFKIIRNSYTDILSRDLENLVRTLSPQVLSLLKKGSTAQLDKFVKKLGSEINTRITVIDPEGVVLADSEENPDLMENHKNRPEIREVFQNKVGKSLRFSMTIKEEMLYIAVPLRENNDLYGFLRASLFLKDINKLISQIRKAIAQITGIFIIIAIIGALMLSRSLSRPIKHLSKAARQLASGKFNIRVFLPQEDELKNLADSFNYMAEKTQNLFTELSRQKEELNNIISSIQYGLLVLDKEGKIKMSNSSFQELAKNKKIQGKFYWEVIREPALEKLINKTSKAKNNINAELKVNNKIFLCSSAFLLHQEEILVIFHDITEIKNTEKIKKDFISNVSHELRTPLTSIKGFVESLKPEIEDKNLHYLDILKRNTDRLINIVNDLLVISELEDKETTLKIENVNLNQLTKDIKKIFEHKLKEKGLKLELILPKKDIIIKADLFQLEQVFINLIDNAIKYTEKGTISINIKRDEKNIVIKIEDGGIGIPKEHLNRIFERFYVVSKSRSRNLGGTGLGLSIVKHIVLLHNGEIEVNSTTGKGTKFIITIPA